MLQNLRIMHRLLAGFGIMVLLIVGLGTNAIITSRNAEYLFSRFDRSKGNALQLAQLEALFFRGRIHVWQAVLSRDDAEWDKATLDFSTTEERLSELVQSTIDPSDAKQPLTRAVRWWRVYESFPVFETPHPPTLRAEPPPPPGRPAARQCFARAWKRQTARKMPSVRWPKPMPRLQPISVSRRMRACSALRSS